MTDLLLDSAPKRVQCPFCLLVNEVTSEDPLCLNCGLALSRLLPKSDAVSGQGGAKFPPPVMVGTPEGDEAGLPEATVTGAPRIANEVAVWSLEFEDGSSVRLAGDDIVVGRAPSFVDGAVPVALSDATGRLSRTHARLRRDPATDAWTIEDLASANGVATVDSMTGDIVCVASGVQVPATEYLLIGELRVRLRRDVVAALDVTTGDISLEELLAVAPEASPTTPTFDGGGARVAVAMSHEFGAARDSDDGVGVATSRRSKLPWVLATCFGVLLVGATVATSAVLLNDATSASPAAVQTTKEPTLSLSLDGWETTPTWSRDIDATAAAATANGAHVAVLDGADAYVLDAATGDTVATLGVTTGATVTAAGDMLLVTDDDATHVWSLGSDAWLPVAVATDATVVVRGGVVFVVSQRGDAYEFERVTSDGSLAKVASPLKGAVPVGGSGDKVVWGSNRGVAYVTDLDGKKATDTKLTPPKKGAKLVSWVGGREDRVVVKWRASKKTVLAVHDLAKGKVIEAAELAEADAEASPLAIGNGDSIALGNLVIDMTASAITSLPGVAVASVGDAVLVDGDDGELLVSGEARDGVTVGGDATPLAVLANGSAVVAAEGRVGAFESRGE